MNFILEEMIELNADGVIFHNLFVTEEDLINGKTKIFADYSLEQFKNLTAYPKSNRTYYKIVDGKLEYIKNKGDNKYERKGN